MVDADDKRQDGHSCPSRTLQNAVFLQLQNSQKSTEMAVSQLLSSASCHVTADTQIPENAGHARAVISLQLYHQGTSCCPPSRISGAPVSDRPTNVPGPVC
ncbi:MAG: hypothetical protein RL215_2369 [Planctomycetota bacterium]